MFHIAFWLPKIWVTIDSNKMDYFPQFGSDIFLKDYIII